MTAPALVQKLWNYCNILRDDGLSYGDSIEVRGRTGFLVSPLYQNIRPAEPAAV